MLAMRDIRKIEEMLKKLEVSGSISSLDKELCVYVVGLAVEFSRESVTFSVKGKTFTHSPETRVTINGETILMPEVGGHIGLFSNTGETEKVLCIATTHMHMLLLLWTIQSPKNPSVIQLLLGHRKLESTVRYLGIEVDDALEIESPQV